VEDLKWGHKAADRSNRASSRIRDKARIQHAKDLRLESRNRVSPLVEVIVEA